MIVLVRRCRSRRNSTLDESLPRLQRWPVVSAGAFVWARLMRKARCCSCLSWTRTFLGLSCLGHGGFVVAVLNESGQSFSHTSLWSEDGGSIFCNGLFVLEEGNEQ